MSSGDLVRTALFDEHVALDANIVDFHGFELPIWYSNIKEEHLATRASAGLLMLVTWEHFDSLVTRLENGLKQWQPRKFQQYLLAVVLTLISWTTMVLLSMI